MFSSFRQERIFSETRTMLAIGLCFICIGFEFGLWGALIPLLSTRLALSPWHISAFLFVVGFGLICAALLLPMTLRLVSTKMVVVILTPAYMLSFTIVLTSNSLAVFYIAGAITGWFSGLLDGSINVQAVEWEKRTGKKALSRFHGLYSLGVMFGASYWVVMSSLGNDLLVSLILLFVPASIAMIMLGLRLPPDSHKIPDNTTKKTASSVPLLLTMLMAILVIISTSVEGGMVDWGGLYFTNQLGFANVYAGIAVAIFSIAMTIGRLCGDRFATYLSPTQLLGWPSLVAALLLLCALISRSLVVNLIAFAGMGLALSNAFPVLLRVYSQQLDARAKVAGVAKITGFGYASIMLGPILFGVVAQWYNYGYTMLCIAIVIGIYALLCLWKIH